MCTCWGEGIPSLLLSFEVTILEAGKKELVKREEGLA